MSPIEVLFFSADPLSAPPHGRERRLLLDEDVQRTREMVRMADHRDALRFDWRPAARPRDLIQALREARPKIVHFSGHGGSEGLVLVGAGGLPHRVGADALTKLFRVFSGDIQLVVLNACFSLPQAEAIAECVGCAIGTRGTISDGAAITFGATFYSALAFSASVEKAYEEALTALALEHADDVECPVLIVRPGVDPAKLVLIPPHNNDGSEPQDPSPPVPKPRPGPETRTRREDAGTVVPPAASQSRPWSLPALLLAASIAAAIAVVESALVVVATSVMLLLIAIGLFLFLRSRTGGMMIQVAAAVVLSAGSVAAGASLVDPPLPPPARAELEAAVTAYRERRYDEAFPVLERAAEVRNPEAMGLVGILYLNGLGTRENHRRAVRWLRRAADAGNARGMNALGTAYERDQGVRQDFDAAMRLYERAADAGSAEAMNNIGGLYRRGLGVQRSDSQAMSAYRRAAAAGSRDGIAHVGLMHDLGLGTPSKPDEAVRWYAAAADSGLSWAMVRIGLLYLEGRGLSPSYENAMTWFTRAAEAGDGDGMNNLGVLHHAGWGVPPSDSLARALFLRAAQAGSTTGMINMGIVYSHGLGVPADEDEAARWFRRAVEAGSPEAAGYMDPSSGRKIRMDPSFPGPSGSDRFLLARADGRAGV